jgi:beta-1,4-mannosyl-glycoprotein beta-1,4-N-acetylglucosaminyltransferase
VLCGPFFLTAGKPPFFVTTVFQMNSSSFVQLMLAKKQLFSTGSRWLPPLPMRRRLRLQPVLFVLGCVSLVCFFFNPFRRSHASVTSSTFAAAPFRPMEQTNSYLPLSQAQSLCGNVSLQAYPQRDRHRKIYDLFLIGAELDWLEIRLHELAPVVDYFVIVESVHTFTNRPKPLFLRDNWSRFSHFSHQIIYRVVETDVMHNESTWDREHFQRNSLLDDVFPSLVGYQAPNLGDVLIVSDVDEIPKPDTLTLLRNCDFPDRVTLRSHFFYYSFQWQHVNGDWWHPQATFYQGDATVKPEDLRMTGAAMEIENSSWHCSSCFSTVAEMQTKITSFSHTEYDQPDFKEASQIVRRVRNGVDLFDRESEQYERVDMGSNLPVHLLRNRRKFSYMLDRDPLNANFQDYPRPTAGQRVL